MKAYWIVPYGGVTLTLERRGTEPGPVWLQNWIRESLGETRGMNSEDAADKLMELVLIQWPDRVSAVEVSLNICSYRIES